MNWVDAELDIQNGVPLERLKERVDADRKKWNEAKPSISIGIELLGRNSFKVFRVTWAGGGEVYATATFKKGAVQVAIQANPEPQPGPYQFDADLVADEAEEAKWIFQFNKEPILLWQISRMMLLPLMLSASE